MSIDRHVRAAMVDGVCPIVVCIVLYFVKHQKLKIVALKIIIFNTKIKND